MTAHVMTVYTCAPYLCPPFTTVTAVAAITGRSFGSSLWGLYTAACDSDAARLDECHTDIGYCSSEESAGVICEGITT